MVERCLRSIASAGGADQVILVDNGNRERRPLLLEPELVDVILKVPNTGFGAAANAGMRHAFADGASYVALLNDDAWAEECWIHTLVDVMERDHGIGAAQPKLLLDGSVPATVNSVGVTIGLDGAGRDTGFGEPDGEQFADGRNIDIFTGGAVLLRREFVEDLGGFDERYFLYYEDVDLALRGAERGWRFRCEPASRVWHAPGTSTSLVGDRVAELRERNRLWTAIRFGSPRTVGGALWLSVRRLMKPPHGVHARGFVCGLAATPRLLVDRVRARQSSH
jgi:N-acetylglucosaminyl-diphospho-decaprenol L-rhamnosyltransferase